MLQAVIDCLYAIKICAEYGSKPFPCYRVGCDANAWVGADGSKRCRECCCILLGVKYEEKIFNAEN